MHIAFEVMNVEVLLQQLIVSRDDQTVFCSVMHLFGGLLFHHAGWWSRLPCNMVGSEYTVYSNILLTYLTINLNRQLNPIYSNIASIDVF